MAAKIEDAIPFDDLKAYMRCDLENGVLYWNERTVTHPNDKIWNSRFANKPVGRRTQHYVQVIITIRGVRYHSVAHRLVMAFALGRYISSDLQVDHRNCNSFDNRISNLRLCHEQQNARNKSLYSNNTSGFKGVSWNARDNAFTAIISVSGENLCLGYYQDPAVAAEAYDAAAIAAYGNFARTNRMLGLLT